MGSDGSEQNMCQMYRCSVVIIALTTCGPLHETMDYRRASLQTEYESLIAAMQNRFIDQDAQLVFRFDNGQQNIWRAKVTGAASIQSKPEVIGGFGAADTDHANALLGHFSTD